MQNENPIIRGDCHSSYCAENDILNKLKEYPFADVPTDFLRKVPVDPQYDHLSFSFPETTCKKIDQLIAQYGQNREIFLASAYALLMHRYSGLNLFSSAILAHDNSKELTPCVIDECFISILQFDLSENPIFTDYLVHANATISNQIKQEHLLPIKNVTNDPSLRTFLHTLYSSSPAIHSTCRNIRCNCENSAEKTKSSSYSDLLFTVASTDTQINGSICFNTEQYKKNTVERVALHYLTLVESIIANPISKISDLNILTEQEKQQLITWNATGRHFPDTACIPELFELQVDKSPNATALIIDGSAITFRELNSRSNQLAHYLIHSGVKIETPVAVCMERSIELMIAILGILKAGATYVPIDPVFPPEHTNAILENCNPPLIITKSFHLKTFKSHSSITFCIDTQWKTVEKYPLHHTGILLDPDNRFYIMYTSGSTGKPKGVEGIYRGIINRLYWMWDTYPYVENDICCHKTSISFVDHIAEIFSPLLKGVPIYILSDKQLHDSNETIDFLIEKKITRILLVPSLLHSILEISTEKLAHLSDLRYVFSSGEALPTSLARQFYQNFRNVRLVNIYGSTEVSADVTYYEIKRFFVGDVLKYFTQSIDLPGGLKETVPLGYINPIQANRVTTADTPIETIASHFSSFSISDYPLTLEQYFKRLYTDVLPHVINTAAPTFIGHMTSALPDFVHDLSKLISQLNQNLVKIETAKSLIFLEREALAILHRCFYACNDAFYSLYIQKVNANLGLVTTGGTTANITALLTARNRALFGSIEQMALSGKSIYSLLREKGFEDITILGTHLMHYSMRKAISVLGLGIDNIMYVSTDESGKLDIVDLKEKIVLCKKRNILVLAIIGIAGSTETGQIDPLEAIGDIAAENQIHFHVDAAWGGTTIFSDKFKFKLKGIEKADSITFCGHKQLYLPQGISVCLFKDPSQLHYAVTTAKYQATADSYDVGKFTLEGSRSAISLCLHAALRLFGKKGYEALVDYSMDLTSFFVKAIKSTGLFELIGNPELNIVNYRYIPERFRKAMKCNHLTIDDQNQINSFNKSIQEKQFLKGKTFVSRTSLTNTMYGKNLELTVFRAVLSNPLATYADLYEVLEDQIAIANEIGNVNESIHFESRAIAPGTSLEQTFLQEQSSFGEITENMISIGKPLYNCKSYVLDQYLNPVPIGIPGDLFIAGAALARGFFNNRELTDKFFMYSPHNPQERLFKTGDRARFNEEGNIEFLGRQDEQVKINGNRIELTEIEYHIGLIENILQNKVLAHTLKNGTRQLTAYLILKHMSSTEHIRDILAQKLPDYMIPSMYKIIRSMPLMPNGKIDKVALAQL